MVRQRIKYELIPNESNRKISYKKRKGGLLKKMNEITTLCGVVGFAIIYSTFSDQPEIWPPPPELINVLNKFNDLPKKKRDKYSVNQKIFLGRSISKLSKWLNREKEKNRERETELTLIKYLAGKSLQDMNCKEDVEKLDLLLEEKIKFITNKIETMCKSDEVIAKKGNKK